MRNRWLGFDTIRGRLLVAFVLISVLPVVIAAAGSVIAEIHNGQQQARERLQSVAVSKETAVKNWIDSLFQELFIVSSSDTGYERISIVLGLANDQKYLDFYNKAVRNRLIAFTGQSNQLSELFLIDVAGTIVLSTEQEQEGQSLKSEAFFLNGLEAPFVAFPLMQSEGNGPDLSSSMVTLAIPIQGGNGEKLGVLAARAGMVSLYKILVDHTGMGDSGKAYILDNQNGMRFQTSETTPGIVVDIPSDPEWLNIEPTGNKNFTIYTNELGKRVIGVSRWLIDDRIVIVVEQDQSEALGAILTTLGINLAIALVALVIAIMLSVVISQGIARPLEKLAETATQIAAGDLIRMAQVGRMDEVGKLALAFNSMTGQLRLLINSLEQRVEERTCDLQRLALRLETSARVSREITSFLQIEDLIDNVTDLIQIGFGYYGVHIYLFDPEANELVFWGKDEMNQPHDLRISVGPNSLNGYVVSNNEALLVNDVSTEARYKGDENFPNTRSELVIPLRIGEQVIGTLDLLSSEIDEFQPEDVLVAQSLADQLAIAIENARLYERSQDLAVLEERNRLAREFHDAMNQSLYSVVLFAGAGQKEAENAGMLTLQRNLERIENMARQALKEMRLMVFELRPKVLEQMGLIGALQQRLDVVERGAGVDVKLVTEGELDLTPEVEGTLYRIIQEALNNSLKHGRGDSVIVQLVEKDRQVRVMIADNGCGFKLHGSDGSKGMGITNMRERAEELNAVLSIHSSPGEGTEIEVLLPANNHPNQATGAAE